MSQLTLASALLLLASGCASAAQPETVRARYLMGTTFEIATDRSELVEPVFEEIARIERMTSTWSAGSELSHINSAPDGQPIAASGELLALLEVALDWARKTGGAFNPLVGPLIEAWKTRGEGAVPEPRVLESLLPRLELTNVRIDRPSETVTRSREARFEEGGFVKGYALDRAAGLLRRDDRSNAVLNFGGQVMVIGGPVEVAVADPLNRDEAIAAIVVSNASVSTTSGSERQFEINGRSFSHLLDPRTGEALPPRGSVTVVHVEGLAADVLSTALYVMGPEDGLAFAEANRIAALFLIPSTSGAWTATTTSRFPKLLGFKPGGASSPSRSTESELTK